MTTFKVSRLSRKGAFNIRRGLKRSWVDGTHRQRVQHQDIDADTLRRRALDDRRGRHYATITINGLSYPVVWSCRGRSDQVDIFCDGSLIATCRSSLVLQTITAQAMPRPSVGEDWRRLACA